MELIDDAMLWCLSKTEVALTAEVQKLARYGFPPGSFARRPTNVQSGYQMPGLNN